MSLDIQSTQFRCSGCSEKDKFCERQMGYGVNKADSQKRTGTEQSDVARFYEQQGLSQEDKFRIKFVSVTKSTKTLYSFKGNPENGILGLGPDPEQSIIYKWFQRSPGMPKIVSICLAENGGHLELGRPVEDPKYETEFIFEGFKIPEANYKIPGIKKISVGTEEMHIPGLAFGAKLQLMLDSGAPSSMALPEFVRENVVMTLRKVCRTRSDQCQEQTFQGQIAFRMINLGFQRPAQVLNKMFPPITFELQGKVLKLSPEEYLLPYGDRFLAIIKSFEKNELVLLGAPFLRNKKVTFDIDKKTTRILTSVDCLYKEVNSSILNKTFSYMTIVSYIGLCLCLAFCLVGRKAIEEVRKFMSSKFGKKKKRRRRKRELVQESVEAE